MIKNPGIAWALRHAFLRFGLCISNHKVYLRIIV